MKSILFSREWPINDYISLYIPTVGQVIENEESFTEAVSILTANPYDMMVQLDDSGIDFTKINDFELFCLMFSRLREIDTRILLGNLDLSKFDTAINPQNENVVLYDQENNIVIDRIIYSQIKQSVCKMMFIEKKQKKPGNEEARKFMIERARAKQKRAQRQQAQQTDKSSIEEVIIGLVNTEQFPYDYETVQNITIYQLYCSLNQISHKIKYDNTMHGYYAGTVKFEDIKMEDRTWIMS